ncbi:regulatory protein, luxR family [Actinomyces ruminicola]|uniref:Regulatory protein, luxR family n=1 Tax=Actinomyces ruminicola TaxID=332524 RepID=A0A1H0EXN4_9ACTO|nr:helix-turn-helix transcriptional regulator [Actinomyces ruminicola]SDN87049.1 regulatory protein, luxR family [Actinomyces ruminicola]
MHALDQRRLVAREIADRLSRGAGSFCLVAAPSVSGVWSLGPALAADVTDLQRDVRVITVDAAMGVSLPLSRPELSIDDAVLIASVNQVFESLCGDPGNAALRKRLEPLRAAVQDAGTMPERAAAAGAFAAAACQQPVLVTIAVNEKHNRLSVAQMERAASFLAATPLAVVVLVPEGSATDCAVPPFFSTSIGRLGPDDARDLIAAETSAYVDPMVAAWIARSAAGRIDDIRAVGSHLTGAELAGRELPRYEPTASAQTRGEVAERLGELSPEQRDALVAMHLQLVPNSAVVQDVVGAVPQPGLEELLPAPEPGPALSRVTATAVVGTAPREAVRDLHAALADAYGADTLERSWHRLGAQTASAADWERLLRAADAELQRGSLNVAWRIIDALLRNRTEPGVHPAQAARTRLLQGQLALQLGCTLTAASRLLEALGRPGMSSEEELAVTAGYIAARGCEGVSVSEDGRLAARLTELGAHSPASAARCLILLAGQERLVGESDGPGAYLRAAIGLLEANALDGRSSPADSDALVLARVLLARVEGRYAEAAEELGNGMPAEIPGDTARSDITVWAQAVIRALLAAEDPLGEHPVVVESSLCLLAGTSPFYEAQAVSVRAFLTSRLGWTRYAQEELEGACYRVPLRVGLVGLGMTLAAQGAMLFDDDTAAFAWRKTMANAVPGSDTSPQQMWVSVLEAAARLAAGDGLLAGLLLGPAVAAGMPRERLRAVWSNIIDMVIIEPALLERVPGLADWLKTQLGGGRRSDPNDRLLAVLLANDDEAASLVSGLVLETVFSGNAVRQVRADMACAARLRGSPGLDVTELGIAADALASARALEARAAEFAAADGVSFWQRVTDRARQAGTQGVSASAGTELAEPELTDTELRVARLAAQGRRNKEIAAELYMAVRTVELRLTGVYRALGISSRRDLPKALAAHGLLED